MDRTVRIAGVVRQSIVDGPGLRMAVFTQGCPHRCPGCHNPHTHDPAGGYDCPVDTILAELDKNPLLRGVTLTGGEPVEQALRLLPLARGVRERGRDIVLFTGYTWEALRDKWEEDPAIRQLLELCHVLIDGPYLQEQRDLTLRFRGSRNQRALDLPASLEQNKPVSLDW